MRGTRGGWLAGLIRTPEAAVQAYVIPGTFPGQELDYTLAQSIVFIHSAKVVSGMPNCWFNPGISTA
jgi:hypothetical protein